MKKTKLKTKLKKSPFVDKELKEKQKAHKDNLVLFDKICIGSQDGIACALSMSHDDEGLNVKGEAAITLRNHLKAMDKYKILTVLIETFEFSDDDLMKSMLDKLKHRMEVVDNRKTI